MKAIAILETGEREVMQCLDLPIPPIQSDEILVKNQATGINFVDTYICRGFKGYFPDKFPHILGIEGAGIVSKVGNDVTDFQEGDRLCYVYTGSGSYAEYTAIKAERAILLPNTIDYETACCLLQGITAQFLTHSTFPLQPDNKVLIHAGAGGVGLMIIQMAKILGAMVITTVSTSEKAQLVSDYGADEVIIYTQDDFADEVMAITQGVGVDVIYDSVGANTFEKDLKALANRGYLVLFGQSSGFVPDFDLNRLCNRGNEGGSFFITRPTIKHYIQGNQLRQRARVFFDYILSGKLKILIGQKYQLEDAPQAHQAIASRSTIGKSIFYL
ncbi:quinone oxidoreductase [Geminocystis sp. GBBB08]|uniref:quinone oxidoreductase family protein n=1 Tax=Geminocystis sp. GBBB08 TaxID=2604140 RepID=UPI0027E32CC2|nr:quinone oxidoreductase [Geminocystis sp. GBBB08]MBL1210481.1 quinone oxidoreductase [Geminocystis sp. GBBB08]